MMPARQLAILPSMTTRSARRPITTWRRMSDRRGKGCGRIMPAGVAVFHSSCRCGPGGAIVAEARPVQRHSCQAEQVWVRPRPSRTCGTSTELDTVLAALAGGCTSRSAASGHRQNGAHDSSPTPVAYLFHGVFTSRRSTVFRHLLQLYSRPLRERRIANPPKRNPRASGTAGVDSSRRCPMGEEELEVLDIPLPAFAWRHGSALSGDVPSLSDGLSPRMALLLEHGIERGLDPPSERRSTPVRSPRRDPFRYCARLHVSRESRTSYRVLGATSFKGALLHRHGAARRENSGALWWRGRDEGATRFSTSRTSPMSRISNRRWRPWSAAVWSCAASRGIN